MKAYELVTKYRTKDGKLHDSSILARKHVENTIADALDNIIRKVCNQHKTVGVTRTDQVRFLEGLMEERQALYFYLEMEYTFDEEIDE